MDMEKQTRLAATAGSRSQDGFAKPAGLLIELYFYTDLD